MSGLDGLGWPNPEDEPKPKTMNDTPETNAARRSSGLREIAYGLGINPDLSVAQKVIRDAADKIEELERERDELLAGMQIIAREGGDVGHIASQFLPENETSPSVGATEMKA
jgi:hypothetical protein